MTDEDIEYVLMDAAHVGTAQHVEHQRLLPAGPSLSSRKLLGENEHASLLEGTLLEEKVGVVGIGVAGWLRGEMVYQSLWP